jgi:hypothetical protein
VSLAWELDFIAKWNFKMIGYSVKAAEMPEFLEKS